MFVITALTMNSSIASRPFRAALLACLTAVLSSGLTSTFVRAAETKTELKNLSINGGLEDGKARLVIEAQLHPLPGDQEKVLYATAVQHSIKVTADQLEHSIALTLDILQGQPTELTFAIQGAGEIRQVTGPSLQDWSVRQETNGQRVLVLRPRKVEPASAQWLVNILAVQPLNLGASKSADGDNDKHAGERPAALVPLTLVPAQPALLSGYLRIEAAPEIDLRPTELSGLVPIEDKFLPQSMRAEAKGEALPTLAYRFQGAAYAFPLELSWADPEARRVVLRDFQLNGQLSDQAAAFTLTATAHVKNAHGGSIRLLAGGVALTEIQSQPDWRVKLEGDQFLLVFDHPGQYPLRLKFNAAVRPSDGWNLIDFRVAPSTPQPVALLGLAPETRFEFAGAARPERVGAEFTSFLPPTGAVHLRWKEAAAQTEGKLFYAAEMLSQITVSPGLMSQAALLDFKVMQGELSQVILDLRGEAEVTRVQGDQVLGWKTVPSATAGEWRLIVQLNQPQQDRFALQLQMQTPFGAFPQVAQVTATPPGRRHALCGLFPRAQRRGRSPGDRPSGWTLSNLAGSIPGERCDQGALSRSRGATIRLPVFRK